MPKLKEPEARTEAVFAAPRALDLLNALYFTWLSGEFEGVGDWPVRTRAAMDPALLAQLDVLFTYPRAEPGIIGALTDVIFFHPEAWTDVDALLDFVRALPPDGRPGPDEPGIRGLAIHALRWPGDFPFAPPPGRAPRDILVDELAPERLAELGVDAVDAVDASTAPARDRTLALFDDPEDVRARLLTAVRRFYDEHYRRDEARREDCMQRSVAYWSRQRAPADMTELMRRLSGRYINCVDIEEPGAYRRFIFVPSVDVGVYNSCIDLPPVHGFFYRCEARFSGAGAAPDEGAPLEQLAAVYKALGDEQRLRILALLREGELYAQEIVERTGLHQSVVSRHLSFLRAVGLVTSRRQNTMKYFSLNPEMGARLREAVETMLPAGERR
jgi:DNA-binding transcriptional ArsR family regulator